MARKSILMLLVGACLVAASSLFILVGSLRDDGAKPTAGRSSASTPTPTWPETPTHWERPQTTSM